MVTFNYNITGGCTIFLKQFIFLHDNKPEKL